MEMAEKYEAEALQRLFMFTDQDAMEKLIIEVKKELPPEMAQKLEEMKDELKTIDGLSELLNTLFTKYGDTLKYNFMSFTYGHKLHTMIRMNRTMYKKLENMKAYCQEHEKDINEIMAEEMEGW